VQQWRSGTSSGRLIPAKVKQRASKGPRKKRARPEPRQYTLTDLDRAQDRVEAAQRRVDSDRTNRPHSRAGWNALSANCTSSSWTSAHGASSKRSGGPQPRYVRLKSPIISRRTTSPTVALMIAARIPPPIWMLRRPRSKPPT
jgi:hypothetical protein